MKDHLLGALAIICVTAVLVMPAACSIHEDRLIADMVKAGVNPLAARCSLRMNSTECIGLRP